MIKNLDEKLRTDLHKLLENIFELINFEELCEQIRIKQETQFTHFQNFLKTQEEISNLA